jgi:Ca2+-binding EF-hand superfamily protein
MSLILHVLMLASSKKVREMLLHRLTFLLGHTYEVVMTDTRKNELDNLTPTELKLIKEQFEILDKDNVGLISKKDIKTHYETFINKEKEMLRKTIDKKIKKEPEKHIEYEHLYAKLCQVKLQQASAAIKVLIEMDTNQDGFIDKNEFMENEARRITALKGAAKSPQSPNQ